VIVGAKLRNRYLLVRQLGSGGFGVTYLAEDEDLPGKPECVVKHFKPRYSNQSTLPIAKNLFDREASVLYRLGQEHDQIPKLYAHFEEDGEFYLVQEYIHGHNIATEIKRNKFLPEPEVFNMLFSVLGALSIVHKHGVIHRDIKPANLMRRYHDGKIVLIDFGAVKEVSTLSTGTQGQTSLTVVVGSSGYMPDEQANGKPKLCSDVYALGMVGIYALTGISPSKLPEDGETGETIWRDRANVSDGLANVIDMMVKPHFSQRYRSADEALQGLLTAVAMAAAHRPGIPVGVVRSTGDLPVPILSAEAELICDSPIEEISGDSDLTIADGENPTDSATAETVVLSDVSTSIPPDVSSLPTHLIDTSTLIAYETEILDPAMSSSSNDNDAIALAKSKLANLRSLSLTRLIVGVGGVGIAATAAVFASLSFSKLSLPERPELQVPKPVTSFPVNPPKTESTPPPKVEQGRITLASGSKYEGELMNGKPQGKGKVIATTYYCVGDFRNGELNGQGFCNYKNGDRYEGEFRNDKFNGAGKIKYAAGNRYEGEFRNDNLNGEGVLIHSDGTRDEGLWENGQLVKRKSIN
jgi:eukaryotic-like serine/threonine-protein kinase